jgi:putative heme-binding domain-containing protein
VYPAAAPEPWRVVRTRLRVQGITPGIVEGGGRTSGYFTGATGVTIFRGDAAPDLKGLAFVGDACSSFVHRKKLTLPVGSVQYRADRIDKESEFLASKDNWFRPVQFANGPDGCLTVIDMYRETIEHPASLPPPIKKHLDLTSGRDRGRLWRVYAEGVTPRTLPKLGGLKTEELVKLLDHPNAWHRETASRLIYERQDKAAVESVREMLKHGGAYGKVHALYTLRGRKALTIREIENAVGSEYSPVREHALRLAPEYQRDAGSRGFAFDQVVYDRDPWVRYQLSFSFGQMEITRPNLVLRNDIFGDPWAKMALLSSLTGPRGGGPAPAGFGLDYAMLNFKKEDELKSRFFADLAAMISRQDNPSEIRYLVKALEKLKKDPGNYRVILSIIKAVHEGGGKNARAAVAETVSEEVIAQFVTSAASSAANGTLILSARVEAIRTLSLGKFADVRATLVKLLDLKQPGEVQLAALGVLDRFNDPELPAVLLKSWETLSPRLRAAAGEALLARPDRVAALLDAIETKTFAPQNLDATQIKRLMTHKDAAIQKRASTLLAAFKPARRTDVVEKYRKALDMTGDPAKGKAIFTKTCAACHKLEGVGHELGPNLSAMKNRGMDAILTNVLDPNAEVNPQYLSYNANLDDGRQVTGMIQAETANSVTFIRGEGLKDVVSRANIETLKSTGLSLMPEGLEKDITVEAMADLIAYLMNLK